MKTIMRKYGMTVIMGIVIVEMFEMRWIVMIARIMMIVIVFKVGVLLM